MTAQPRRGSAAAWAAARLEDGAAAPLRAPTPFMAQIGMAAARLWVRANSEVMVAHSQQPMAMTVLRAMK